MKLGRAVCSILAIACGLLLLQDAPALAQCAMCKAVVSGAANNAAMAKGLNMGVLVLLVPPVTIFCSIFIVAYKHRKGRGEEETTNRRD